MPQSIRDYIKMQLPSVWSISKFQEIDSLLENLLTKMFLYPPFNLDTLTSPHFSNRYREQQGDLENATLMTIIVEKIFVSLSVRTPSGLSFLGQIPFNPCKEKDQKILYLINMALKFSSASLGNCATRCSYAAIELFEILRNTGIQVKVKSWSEIDQFVICLKDSAGNVKIYDPLTNPELLFDKDEYERDVKSLFKPVASPKSPFDLTMDEKIRAKYVFQANKITAFLMTQRNDTSLEELKSNDDYLFSIGRKGIVDTDFKKTARAYREVCRLLDWPLLASEETLDAAEESGRAFAHR